MSKVHECATCFRFPEPDEPNFSVCARCHIKYYCSRECQQIGWSTHKVYCNKPKILLNKADYKGLSPGSVVYPVDDLFRFRHKADIPAAKGPDKIAYIKVFRSWRKESDEERFQTVGPFHMVYQPRPSEVPASGPHYPGLSPQNHDLRYSIVGPFYPVSMASTYIKDMICDCSGGHDFWTPETEWSQMEVDVPLPPGVALPKGKSPERFLLDVVMQDEHGMAALAEVHIPIASRPSPHARFAHTGDKMIMQIQVEKNPEVVQEWCEIGANTLPEMYSVWTNEKSTGEDFEFDISGIHKTLDSSAKLSDKPGVYEMDFQPAPLKRFDMDIAGTHTTKDAATAHLEKVVDKWRIEFTEPEYMILRYEDSTDFQHAFLVQNMEDMANDEAHLCVRNVDGDVVLNQDPVKGIVLKHAAVTKASFKFVTADGRMGWVIVPMCKDTGVLGCGQKAFKK